MISMGYNVESVKKVDDIFEIKVVHISRPSITEIRVDLSGNFFAPS